MRTCIACKRGLPPEAFNKNPTYKSGLAGKCRECCGAYSREYGAANRERLRAYGRAWYQANKEAIAVAAKAKRRTAEERRPARAKYYAENREKLIAAAVEAMHRRRAGGGSVSNAEWERKAAHGHACAYCGRGGPLQRDHVVPLARGGKHCASNIRPACKPCNVSKGARPLHEWPPYKYKMWLRNSAVSLFPHKEGAW